MVGTSCRPCRRRPDAIDGRVLLPELVRLHDLRDDEVLVELQQPGVLLEHAVLVLQLLVDLLLELGQQLLQHLLDRVALADLRRGTLGVGEVECRRAAIVQC